MSMGPDIFGGALDGLSPGFLLILAGLLATLLPRATRPFVSVAAPLLGLVHLLALPAGPGGMVEMLGISIATFDVTQPGFAIAVSFLAAATIAGIFNWHERAGLPVAAGLIYTGCATGAVLAGDLPSFFIFFEISSIAAAFLIWSGGTSRSLGAGMRFAVANILAGVLLLEAFLLTYKVTGSISFFVGDLSTTAGVYLILALGIRSAFPVLHAWLTDAYPESTPGGTVLLSVFAVTTSVYALMRFLPGEQLLTFIGPVMIAFPVFLALLANDLRRALCYGLISQVGLAVTAVGIGTPEALAAATTLAVANIFGFLLMFMAIGAVLFRTGTASAASLGGLAAQMPWTAGFAVIGGLSVAGLPILAGGTAIPALLTSIWTNSGPYVAALALFGVAGVWAHAGLRVPAAAFFGERQEEHTVSDAPLHMRLAMMIGVLGCVGIGSMPYWDNVAFDAAGLVLHMQGLAFSLLVFAAARAWGLLPRDEASALIDVDWLYRRLGPAIVATVMSVTSAAYSAWQNFVSARLVGTFRAMFTAAGPQTNVAATWGTGLSVLWVAILLVVMLLVSYV
ncbi:MAG: proton-conducting transporter membrane subunit [Alphaproteobacteria bacterium]|nr:proton-conducting transporter membrane subunit [Alphaproteobacteria bacterium]